MTARYMWRTIAAGLFVCGALVLGVAGGRAQVMSISSVGSWRSTAGPGCWHRTYALNSPDSRRTAPGVPLAPNPELSSTEEL